MRDEWFIRGKVPMTKSEVRAISISKLELTQDSVLYDIGAGTGSVSVEAALSGRCSRIYAVEKKKEALELILDNARIFGASQIQVVAGSAPAVLKGLESPTHAFIGGTSGKMEQIIRLLLEKNPNIRVVINVIALESLAEIMEVSRILELQAEIVSVAVSRAELTAGYHLMKGQNPVYVISFGGEDAGLVQ